MDGRLTTLPLMYTAIVAATGHIFAESNDSFISTLCLRHNWNWPFEKADCIIVMQLDEVAVIRLAPLRNDFIEHRVRMNNK